jgi:hypothetical protein
LFSLTGLHADANYSVRDSWVQRYYPEFTFGFDVFLAFYWGFFFALPSAGVVLFLFFSQKMHVVRGVTLNMREGREHTREQVCQMTPWLPPPPKPLCSIYRGRGEG